MSQESWKSSHEKAQEEKEHFMKSRLDQARESRDAMVAITHRCGHVMKHPIVGRYGIKVFVAREESRVCMACARTEKEAVSWAQVEAAKAVHRARISASVTHLAAIEITQASGRELTGLELATLLINHFKDYQWNAWDLCKKVGFDPEEIVTLERLIG